MFSIVVATKLNSILLGKNETYGSFFSCRIHFLCV